MAHDGTPSAEGARVSGRAMMTWTEAARLGKLMKPGLVDDAANALGGAPDLRSRLEPVLNDMAATSPDAAGIRAADGKLTAALSGFVDASWTGSGDSPRVAMVKQCALVLFHGLLDRAGEQAKAGQQPDDDAVALIAATRAIQAFRAALRDELLAELMNALGPDLYDRATRRTP
jgi:hypothetical protein